MSKQIPFEMVLEKAYQYKAEMSQFLRDMIAIPSESCDEERVVLRIKEEMEKVGFDKVEIDPMGNVLGYIGHGPHLIHITGQAFGPQTGQGLDRVKDHQSRRFRPFQDGVHVFGLRGGQGKKIVVQKPQTGGPTPDLGQGFLPAHVHDLPAGGGHLPGHLQQQGRLADARLAAHQHSRARHQTFAEDAVQGFQAGAEHGGGRVRYVTQTHDRLGAPGKRRARRGGNAHSLRLKAVPLPTGGTLPLPLGGTPTA